MQNASNRRFGYVAIVFSAAFAAGTRGEACLPPPIDVSGEPELTVAQAQDLLRSRHHVEVESDSKGRCPGAGPSYNVREDGELLVTVVTPSGGNEGAILLKAVEGALKTPKRQLRRLIKAHKELLVDMKLFKNNFGVGFSFRNALPLMERYPELQVQRLSVSAAECAQKDYSSSSVSFGLLDVGLSEYVPGRTDYPNSMVYDQGELGKKFSKAQDGALFKAYTKRLELNAKNCDFRGEGEKTWSEIHAGLRKHSVR